jgi:uroporphyrinogen decarboxylase
VPHALGQKVSFEDGQGPILQPLTGDVGSLDTTGVEDRLAPIHETVRLVRQALSPEKALIGFCGAPWTVATYMIAGQGTPDQLAARRLALQDPVRLQSLVDVLVDASARYLVGQIKAGADVVKIFDSWAGVLDEEGFDRWCVRPIKSIVDRVRAAAPNVPIIAFPRGAGARLGGFAMATGVDAVAIDWMTPMSLARELVPAPTALQGNLDPLRLVVGGNALDDGVDTILAAMEGRPHIFNLGHGITPDTPIEHVERLVERVRRRRV